jgi:hypothetical protein
MSLSGVGGMSPHLQLLALHDDMSTELRKGQRREIDQLDKRIEAARAFQRAELERAQEEQEDASMWEDVAGTFKTVSIVAASAAAIAASGGAGAPLVLVAAGAAIKIGGKIAEETDVIGDDVALALDIGGSLAMGAGAAWGAAAAGTQAANAASAAAEGANTASSCSTAVTTVDRAAEATSMAASAGSGVATKVSKDHQANAVDANANADRFRSAGDSANEDREGVITRATRTTAEERWFARQTARAMSSENQGRTATINDIGR